MRILGSLLILMTPFLFAQADKELFADGSIAFHIQSVQKGENSLIKIENKVLDLAQITFFDPETQVDLVHVLSAGLQESTESLAKVSVPFPDLNQVSPSLTIPKSLIHQKTIGLRLTHVSGESFEYRFHSKSSVANIKIQLEFPTNEKFRNNCYTVWAQCDEEDCSKKCCSDRRDFCVDCVNTCEVYCPPCEGYPY